MEVVDNDTVEVEDNDNGEVRSPFHCPDAQIEWHDALSEEVQVITQLCCL